MTDVDSFRYLSLTLTTHIASKTSSGSSTRTLISTFRQYASLRTSKITTASGCSTCATLKTKTSQTRRSSAHDAHTTVRSPTSTTASAASSRSSTNVACAITPSSCSAATMVTCSANAISGTRCRTLRTPFGYRCSSATLQLSRPTVSRKTFPLSTFFQPLSIWWAPNSFLVSPWMVFR